jgi:hypothetical protein
MKYGIFLAAGAFVLSFIIGLFSAASIIVAVIRAVVFAAVFFGIGCGAIKIFTAMLTFQEAVPRPDGDGEEHISRRSGGNFGAEFSMSDDALGLYEDGTAANDVPKSNETKDEIKIDDISMLFDAGTDVQSDGGLEQSTAPDYTEAGSVVNPALMNGASEVSSSVETNENLSDFTPAAEDAARDFVPGFPVAHADMSGAGVPNFTAGTVEMSLASPKPKSDIDFSGHDGKKMAGAIQTILKKDKE